MIARTTTSVSHAARAALAALAAFVLSLAPLQPGAAVFEQTNLVSSVSGLASHTDANLKNPWGIAFSATGPFWVANQVTNKATVYNGAGQPFPTSTPLVVTLVTSGGPTGLVFNATSDFQLFTGGAATFLFATLSGSIEGWNPGHGTMTEVRVLATDGASYTGLAPGNNGSGNFLYAADTANNKIDIYDAQFQKTSVAGSFTDPVLPAGFTVYNIQNLAGTLFVTYENESAGGGIVDAFDLNGNFLRRVTANAAGGPLDSPWGLVIAPASFGPFGGADRCALFRGRHRRRAAGTVRLHPSCRRFRLRHQSVRPRYACGTRARARRSHVDSTGRRGPLRRASWYGERRPVCRGRNDHQQLFQRRRRSRQRHDVLLRAAAAQRRERGDLPVERGTGHDTGCTLAAKDAGPPPFSRTAQTNGHGITVKGRIMSLSSCSTMWQ